MARLWRSILCQRVLTDSQTNTASYIDGVEGYGVPKLPYVFLPIVVGTVWRREAAGDRIVARLRVRDSSGAEVLVYELPEVALATDVHRLNVQIGGFKIAAAGEYEVIVDQRVGTEWTTVSVLPLYVEVVQAPVATASAAPASKAPATK